jgi:hypothetical protein
MLAVVQVLEILSQLVQLLAAMVAVAQLHHTHLVLAPPAVQIQAVAGAEVEVVKTSKVVELAGAAALV